ncbi:hypothetical protein D3C87_1685320 [compost metagenome]
MSLRSTITSATDTLESLSTFCRIVRSLSVKSAVSALPCSSSATCRSSRSETVPRASMALRRFQIDGPRAGTEAGLEGGSGLVGA